MSDYNNYDFTISIEDLCNVLKDAHGGGYGVQVLINGMYYNVTFPDDAESEKSK